MSSLLSSGAIGSPRSPSDQGNYVKALAKSGLPVPLLIVKEDSLGQAAADFMAYDEDYERESSSCEDGPQRPPIKAAVEVSARCRHCHALLLIIFLVSVGLDL